MSARILRGIPASPGVGLGRVHLQHRRPAADGRLVAVPDRAAELDRARASLAAAAAEVDALAAQVRADGRADDAEILATGALIAHDPTLLEEVATRILEHGATVETAILEATEHLAAALAALGRCRRA